MAPVPDPKLREDVARLTRHVEALVQHMDKLVHDKVQDEVAEKTVPREELRKTLQRWWVAGLLIMLLVVATSIATSRVTLVAACVDTQASFALRHQWARVAEIIEGSQQRKPGQPGYIPPKDAGKLFADSYNQALKEAGPAPRCRGLWP